jgi:dimethylargininase
LSAFDFTHALVRKPAHSVTDGLRDGDHAGPPYDAVKREHEAYVATLRKLGLEVDVLPALEDYPDSIFVEDPALVFSEGAILLRPGAPTRAGEVAEIAPELEARFGRVLTLGDGYVDGGDVLTTPDEVLIGLSERTDAAGAKALIAALAELGRKGRVVTTPPGVLHFKTGCGLIDEETVAIAAALDDAEMFGALERMILPAGEEAAANILRIRDTVLIGEGFPKTREMIENRGVKTLALPISEIAKIDAGLSCMSLRWRAVAS